MGVPKFFRYLSERYPCINELVKESQIPDFDNLYLDMNGIIHNCSHPKDFDVNFSITEEQIFSSIFSYIEFLFNLIKPKKLFFMAVDGVAPRAKMNQQRARRFKSAKEAELLIKKNLEQGVKLPKGERFDSNCITPGTVFMDRLNTQLMYFVSKKITTDPLWQGCKVIFSGHQTPGEGEHKIMDYIRFLKTLPDYDANTKHCLYGLDADLITLGLCTHEPYFSLLREKVQLTQKDKIVSPSETEFYLLHLSLFREYLDLEFQDLKEKLLSDYSLENIIDDWVLLGFLVGNDFIPHLPDMHIKEGALPILYKVYKKVRPTLDGYLNENGYLNLPRFQKYMEVLGERDLEAFDELFNHLPDDKLPFEASGKLDLERLIRCTKNIDESDDCSSDDYEDEILYKFCEHKKNYYLNKLKYKEVNQEVLQSQAEGYIRAIQWNLFYYYLGCQSWSWYYPHHYAPYISDIKNFKELSLEFEMGQPFLPFEQLLAVLPPGSSQLLPPVYRDLMTSPNSSIIDFYPKDFETDLNGKQQEWEAVVLIPFIDEKKILKAMEPLNNNLTKNEKLRNRHTPMYVYTYTEEDLGLYKSHHYFPNIESNHALMKKVDLSQIMVDKSFIKFGLKPKVCPDAYYLGFPTLRHIPYTASLKECKVKVFEFVSKYDSILIKVTPSRNRPSIKNLIKTLLGQTVFINWPYLTESKVVSISNGQFKYSLANGMLLEETIRGQAKLQWLSTRQILTSRYYDTLAVDIGPTDVIVYASVLEGYQYVFENGTAKIKKIWSELITPCPFQVVVKDINVVDSSVYKHNCSYSIQEVFPPSSTVFMLSQPHFGAKGRVLEYCSNERIKVNFETEDDLILDENLKIDKTTYLPSSLVAQKLGLTPRLLKKITGSVPIRTYAREKCSKIDIGINLKNNKKNEEIPGYTRRENDNWSYSLKAIKIVSEYIEKFPRVVECVSNCPAKDFDMINFFPNPEDADVLKEILIWIKNQEYQKIEPIRTGSEVLTKEAVMQIEKIIDNFNKNSVKVNMQVKPHFLYKTDLVMGNSSLVKNQSHKLLDRVVCVKSTFAVPVGLKGIIIGIHKATLENDNIYDIIFDKPFYKGLRINSSKDNCFKMSSSSFLNISDAKRKLYEARKKPVQGVISKNQLKNTSLKANKIEPNVSTFTQCSQLNKPLLNEDQFQKLWSDLLCVKTHQEIDTLNNTVVENNLQQNDLNEGHKVMDEIILPDGAAYTRLPCEKKQSACENPSFQAVNEIRSSHEQLIQKSRDLQVKESQAKFDNALLENYDQHHQNQILVKDDNNYKFINHNKTNNRSDNLPFFLPKPPPHWIVQPTTKSSSCYTPKEMKQEQNKTQDFPNSSYQKTTSLLEFVPFLPTSGVQICGVQPISQVYNHPPVKLKPEVLIKTEAVSRMAESESSSSIPSSSKNDRPNTKSKTATNFNMEGNF